MMGYLLVLLWICFCNVIDIYVFSLMFPGIFRVDLSHEYVSKNGESKYESSGDNKEEEKRNLHHMVIIFLLMFRTDVIYM